jgi:hypothetical protein
MTPPRSPHAAGVAILVPKAKVPTLQANGMRTHPLNDVPGSEVIFPDGRALDAAADAIVPIPPALWHFQ